MPKDPPNRRAERFDPLVQGKTGKAGPASVMLGVEKNLAQAVGNLLDESSIGERVRAKNEAARQAAADALDTLPPPGPDFEAEVDALSTLVETAIAQQGGRRKKHQRGGADTAAERIAFVKAIAMMALYNAGQLGAEGVEAAKPVVVAYIQDVFAPAAASASRLGRIALGLANQLVRVPITLGVLAVAGFGYTANVVAQLMATFNQWGAGTSAYLLSDAAASAAAAAVTASREGVATTLGVTVAVLNQLGFLPLSAVIGAILFSLKINLGSGPGRGYLLTSFYTWYLGQTDAAKKEIVLAATGYAKAAKAVAKGGVAAAQPSLLAAAAAAKQLGPLLAQKFKGRNAFETVAETVTPFAEPTVAGVKQEPAAPPGDEQQVEAALVDGASVAGKAATAVETMDPAAVAREAAAAAEAAGQGAAAGRAAAEAALAPAPTRKPRAAVLAAAADAAKALNAAAKAPRVSRAAVGPKGGRKTKKRGSKRRVTRRNKPTKFLGSPVFIY